MRDLFMFTDNTAAQGLTDVKVEPFLSSQTDREAWLADGNGFLLVHRRGGRYYRIPGTDQTITEIAALTKSRDESNTLIAYATDVLEAFGEDGATVYRSTPHLSGLSTTFMKVPGEVVGPQLIPELTRDDRYVSTTWEIHADRPRGLPDYREVLGLDD
jgi:hypothetical protein